MWLQHMTPARLNMGDIFDSGHLNRKMYTTHIPHPGPGTWFKPACLTLNIIPRGFALGNLVYLSMRWATLKFSLI